MIKGFKMIKNMMINEMEAITGMMPETLELEQAPKNNSRVNPSIGQIGQMYFDKVNDRIKFFSTDIHTDKSTIDSCIDQAMDEMALHGTSRFAGRFFVSKGMHLDNVEARIPLNGAYSDLDLVYIGVVSSERREPLSVEIEEDAMVNRIYDTQRNSRDNLPPKYSIERLDFRNLTRRDLRSMIELYSQAFTTYLTELNHDNILKMVENSKVYAVRYENSSRPIVATVVAEQSEIDTPRGTFNICELSEMATLRTHRGKGLMTYATEQLVNDISRYSNSSSLIYAEARACHAPINKSFYNLGFEYAGRLEKQCMLSGDSDIQEHGPFENLNVWYMPIAGDTNGC
jgi:beta-lysine N6-acetyltransferase